MVCVFVVCIVEFFLIKYEIIILIFLGKGFSVFFMLFLVEC